MNGFHITPELLRQIEVASTAMESIRRAQKALDHAPVLEGIRRAEEALNHSQLSASILRAQKVFDHSPALEGIRRMQAAMDNSQLFESIRRAQKAFDRSPVLEGIRRMQAAMDNSQLFESIRRANRLATLVAEIEVTRERARWRYLLGRRLRKVGQTATNRFVGLASRRKIRRPVGSSLRGVAEFVFSMKAFEQIYDPLISDLRVEHFDALASNRKWKARWVRARGYGSFLKAALAHAAASSGDLVARLRRIFQAGGYG